MERNINADWIKVDPIHCHKRLSENSLVKGFRVASQDGAQCEYKIGFNPSKLGFFYDHKIDHLPGMLEVCALRQVALVGGHLGYDIPMDYMMVLNWLDVKLYSFGEIAPTLARTTLCEYEKSKSRVKLILDGILLQGDVAVMRMKGEMLAFHPKMASRIRNTKVEFKNIVKKIKHDEKKNNLIIEAHIIANKDKFASVCSELRTILDDKREASKYSLIPLYFSYDEKDCEIRVCFKFTNPKLFGDYLVKNIRSINGVLQSQARLTLDGKIFNEGVNLLTANDNLISSHIYVEIEPKHDTAAWQELSKLTKSDDVFPTWCMRDFYDYDRSVSLRLMGKTKTDIEKYIDKKVKTINGIKVSRVKYMNKLIKIQSDQVLLSLANTWSNTE